MEINQNVPGVNTTPNRLYLEALLQYDRGHYEGSKQIAEESLALQGQHADGADEGHRVDHMLFCNTLLLLANISAAIGKVSESVGLYSTCEFYLAEHLGPSFIGIATCRINKAITLFQSFDDEPSPESGVTGADADELRNQEAMALLQSCKSILQDVFGHNRLLLADVHHNLGCILFTTGFFVEALRDFLKSLKIREKFQDEHGEVDQSLALTMTAVASLLRLEGNLEEAIRIYTVVAELETYLLGSISLQRCETLSLLGATKVEAGQLHGARETYHLVVNMKAELLGQDHPETQETAIRLLHVEEMMEAHAAAVADRASTGLVAAAAAVGKSNILGLPLESHPVNTAPSGVRVVDPKQFGRATKLPERPQSAPSTNTTTPYHNSNADSTSTSVQHVSMSTIVSTTQKPMPPGLPLAPR